VTKITTIRVNTDSLKPDDNVVGSERQEIMVSPPGLYVDRIKQDDNTYGVWVWWRGATQPELFNPYWTWYVIRKETQNGTTEERPV
jgi:hypothetical protein